MSSFLLNPLTLPQPQNQFHQNGLSQALQQHLPNYSRPDYRHASHSPPSIPQQPTNNPASPLTFTVQTAAQPTATSPALKRKQIDQTSVLGLKRRRETNAGTAPAAAGTSSGNAAGNASAGGSGANNGGGDDGDGYDMDGGNAGAKHWTDDEKSRLFNWLMGSGQEDHWNALRATKNSCLRECAQEVFGARKTYQALKGCYERNFNLFKQIYAFESAHGQPAGAPHLANLSEADRLREYERRLSVVRKTTDVGSITARTIDHWHRVGWYDLFYRRWHGDPATTRPIQQQGGHARNTITGGGGGSSNSNNNSNNTGGGNANNNNSNDDGDGDDDGNNNGGGNSNAMDFQDSHSHSSGLSGLQQQQQQQQQHAGHGMGGHAGHGMQHERQQSHQQQQQHYTINPQDLRDPSSSSQQQQQQQQQGRHQAPGLHSQQSSSHLTQQQQQQHHNPAQQGQGQGQQQQQGQQGQQNAQQQQHGMHVPGNVMGIALNQQHLNALHGGGGGGANASGGGGGGNPAGNPAEPLGSYLNAALNNAAGMGAGGNSNNSSTLAGGVGVVGVGMGSGAAMGVGVGGNPGAAVVSGIVPGGAAGPGSAAAGVGVGVGVGVGGGLAQGQGQVQVQGGTAPMLNLTLPSDLAARWVYALTLQNQLAQEKLEYLKRRESRELKEFAARKEMEKTVNSRVKSEKAFELISNPNADPGLKQAATEYLRKMFMQDDR